jgi:hypothetical protein
MISYFCRESSHFSVSLNVFLSQPLSAVQHGSSEYIIEQHVGLAQLYFKYSLPENVTENSSASF